MDKSTRIIDLTVGELQCLIEATVKKTIEANKTAEADTEYVYGLDGLAECLGKSKNYVSYMLSSGQLDAFKKAIHRNGKMYVTNKTMLMKMLPSA